jgi:hypothetical protein
LNAVSDEQLRHGLKSLLGSGARTEARIVAHIAEVEARKLHLRDGSPSAFEYCRAQLGLSESEAFHRLTAARIARKYPIVFSMMERREIHHSRLLAERDFGAARVAQYVEARRSHASGKLENSLRDDIAFARGRWFF